MWCFGYRFFFIGFTSSMHFIVSFIGCKVKYSRFFFFFLLTSNIMTKMHMFYLFFLNILNRKMKK